MSNSRKIKKILLLTDLVEMEEEEFDELDTQYSIEFQRDFRKESDFLEQAKIKSNNQQTEISSPELALSVMKKEDLKRLHRQLARATHPDLSKSNSEEDFKKIQKAYDEGNGPALLKEAIKRHLDIDVSNQTFDAMKKSLDAKRHCLESKKNSAQWLWCRSDKNDELKKKIQETMGINREEFDIWCRDN